MKKKNKKEEAEEEGGPDWHRLDPTFIFSSPPLQGNLANCTKQKEDTRRFSIIDVPRNILNLDLQ